MADFEMNHFTTSSHQTETCYISDEFNESPKLPIFWLKMTTHGAFGGIKHQRQRTKQKGLLPSTSRHINFL